MYQVIIVIHVLLSLGIIGLILMQQGKGADAGASFGTGSSGSVFGAQGAASFLSRSTAILATLFFITSLTLAVMSGQKSSGHDLMSQSTSEQAAPAIPETAPAIPAPTSLQPDNAPVPVVDVPAVQVPAPAVAPEAVKKP